MGYEETAVRGGRQRLYPLATLPPAVAKQCERYHTAQEQGAEARRELEARDQARTLAHVKRTEEDARRQQVTSDQLGEMLTAHGVEKFDAKFEVVLLWKDYWNDQVAASTPKKPGRKVALAAFATGWAAGKIAASAALKAAFPEFSARSLERWDGDFQKTGVAGLADLRCSGLKRKKSVFDLAPALKSAFLAILSQKPHIQAIDLHAMLNACRFSREDGEVLFPIVQYGQVTRYKKKWEAENKQALTLATNPDAFKSKYLSSLGNASADVLRLNQLWEMDGTPADWLLNYGSKKARYTASVGIDVWGRRPKIRFSRTARSETNKLLLRDMVMQWGMFESVKTDNGSDYKSHEFRLFVVEMGGDQIFCPPFSPQKKPHVERFIGTYLHSMLEVLDAFVGHNVAERAAIEAKRTFADNLFKKNEVVAVDLTVEELQALTDAWIEGTYMQREHTTLGMTPFARVASSTTPIKRVENERALDMLLLKPVKKAPTISAKGIRYQGVTYIHEELPLHAGKLADIRLDPEDMGKIIVRVDGKFLCVAVNGELAGVPRAEIAAKGHAKQKQWIKETNDLFKKAKKGLISPDQLAREIVMDRAVRAGKLAVLPTRGEVHTSAGLDEAARAAASQATPPAYSAKAEQLIAEAHALINQFNPLAPVLELPVKGDRMGADNPLSGFTDEEKYTLWHELDAVVRSGGEGGNPLPHDWQRRFHAGFCKTSKFAAMAAMKEAFGQ